MVRTRSSYRTGGTTPEVVTRASKSSATFQGDTANRNSSIGNSSRLEQQERRRRRRGSSKGKASSRKAERTSSKSEFDDKENLKPDGVERVVCPLSPRRPAMKRQPLGELDVINNGDECESPKPSKIQRTESIVTPRRGQRALPPKEPTIQSPIGSLNAIDKVRKGTPVRELPAVLSQDKICKDAPREERAGKKKEPPSEKPIKDRRNFISRQPSRGGQIFSPRGARGTLGGTGSTINLGWDRRSFSPKEDLTQSGGSGLMNTIRRLKAGDYEMPPRCRVEECKSLTDENLTELRKKMQEETKRPESPESLQSTYGGGSAQLHAAVMKLDDQAIGFIIFSKLSTALGSVTAEPASKLIHMYLKQSYRTEVLGASFLNWFVKNHVKSVKYFSVVQPDLETRVILDSIDSKEVSQDQMKRTYVSSLNHISSGNKDLSIEIGMKISM